MVRNTTLVWTLIVSGMLAASAAAQTPAPAAQPAERPPNRNDLRHQIYVMEGALQRAVQFGAQQLNREIRTFSPEMMTLAGVAQARGVYLEGYGVFFDVGVPILQQSMVWSLRTMLQQDDESVRQTITVLKTLLNAERDPEKRIPLENTIARLELELRPAASGRELGWPWGLGQPLEPRGPRPAPGAPAQKVGAATIDPDATPAPPAAAPSPSPILSATDRLFLKDPNRAYTEAVQGALIDAMIDYAAPMRIAADEWLTVAARDNAARDSLAPQDPLEEVVTVLLRIKGADLAAYRSGAIDREETKKRVQIREF